MQRRKEAEEDGILISNVNEDRAQCCPYLFPMWYSCGTNTVHARWPGIRRSALSRNRTAAANVPEIGRCLSFSDRNAAHVAYSPFSMETDVLGGPPRRCSNLRRNVSTY